jgi:hypothetical protein
MKIELLAPEKQSPSGVLERIRDLLAADGWSIFVADPPSVEAIGEAATQLHGKPRPLLIKIGTALSGAMEIAIHAVQHEKPGRILNIVREKLAGDGWDILVADPPTPDAVREARQRLANKSRPLLITVYRSTPIKTTSKGK